MRALLAVAFVFLVPLGLPAGADERNFSGDWTFDSQRSDLRGLPVHPGAVLSISQQGPVFRCTEAGAAWLFRSDGAESSYKIRDSSMSSEAKWEGTALLINTLVSGPQNYVVEDRWQLSRNGAVLTINRTIRRGTAESESTLVYHNAARLAAAPSPPGSNSGNGSRPGPPAPDQIVLKAGTKIPLSLVNSLNTKHTIEGDRVYLETAFPVMQDGRIIVPKGSYVAGTVTSVKRPQRTKGRAELYIRFDTLTLPNGVTRDFLSRLDNADGQDVDRQEGKIRADPDKAGDAKKVGEAAGAGATIGGLATRSITGLGVGAATGAAVGLAAVLFSHGPDVILPKGTTLEMVLDRDLHYTPRELEAR
ncbi:MAG TPA: hypothetical protein VMI94_10980 [Bryobacteraceae bacterium]|nr:hypothetical protein [Bryobacteraceae bacterium]